MELPWTFSDPQEEARRAGLAFQRLSTNDRLRQLADTINAGMIMLRESPHRAKIDELYLKREAEWKQFYEELFRQHG